MITDLTHIGTEPHLILEGAIRLSKGTRVNARLNLMPEAKCIWSERYTLAGVDDFKIQEQLARTCLEQTQRYLSEGEWSKIWVNRQISTITWEHFQAGRYFENQYSPSSNIKAVNSYTNSLRTDPSFSPAKIAAGFCLIDSVRLGWSLNKIESLEQARTWANEVLLSEKHNGYATALAAFVEIASGNHKQACLLMDSALTNFGNESPELLGYHGAILGYAGDLEAEYSRYKEALTLSSYPPLWIRSNLALVCILLELDEAQSVAKSVLAVDSSNIRAHVFLTAEYARNGDIKSAKAWSQKLLNLQPDFTVQHWCDSDCFSDFENYNRIAKYLELVGLQ